MKRPKTIYRSDAIDQCNDLDFYKMIARSSSKLEIRDRHQDTMDQDFLSERRVPDAFSTNIAEAESPICVTKVRAALISAR